MISFQKPSTIQFLFTLFLAMIVPIYAGKLPTKLSADFVPKTRKQLDSIILGAAHLEKTTIAGSRNFVLSRSRELDSELDPSKKGAVIIIIPTEPITPKLKADKKAPILITYHARKVSVTKVLIEIAKQGKLDLYITSTGVVFCPIGKAPFPNRYAKKGDILDVLYKHKVVIEKNDLKLKPAN